VWCLHGKDVEFSEFKTPTSAAADIEDDANVAISSNLNGIIDTNDDLIQTNVIFGIIDLPDCIPV
jgi:hypothetical protein